MAFSSFLACAQALESLRDALSKKHQDEVSKLKQATSANHASHIDNMKRHHQRELSQVREEVEGELQEQLEAVRRELQQQHREEINRLVMEHQKELERMAEGRLSLGKDRRLRGGTGGGKGGGEGG